MIQVSDGLLSTRELAYAPIKSQFNPSPIESHFNTLTCNTIVQERQAVSTHLFFCWCNGTGQNFRKGKPIILE